MVAVRKDSPIKTMADLIAAAKANPGKLTYSSVGVGSTQHLAGELFCAMAGIKMTHVPYRGGGGPMTDLLGGQIDLNVDTITVIEPQLRAGKVTVLGVTSGEKMVEPAGHRADRRRPCRATTCRPGSAWPRRRERRPTS